MIRLQVLHPILIPSPSIFSPPCPSLLFFFSFFSFLSPTLWFTGLCGGCWCQHGACPEGLESPLHPPRQAGEYLLTCLSVFLSPGRAVHSRILPIPRFCAFAISSHLPTQRGHDEPYFNMGAMDRLPSDRLNELRQSERRQLHWPPPFQKSLLLLHGQTALGELSARPLWLLALTEARWNLLSF